MAKNTKKQNTVLGMLDDISIPEHLKPSDVKTSNTANKETTVKAEPDNDTANKKNKESTTKVESNNDTNKNKTTEVEETETTIVEKEETKDQEQIPEPNTQPVQEKSSNHGINLDFSAAATIKKVSKTFYLTEKNYDRLQEIANKSRCSTSFVLDSILEQVFNN